MKALESKLLTVEELMERLKVSRNTTYQLLATKKIEGFKVGRTWRIPTSSVELFIVEQINAKEEKHHVQN